MSLASRVAAAPISWGVCEVPGWGAQLPPQRVLAEMAELGFGTTELGSHGYLPTEPEALSELLDRHGLDLLGGFVALVLHDPSEHERTIDTAHRAASLLAGTGGRYFVTAAVASWDWGARPPLSATEWEQALAMVERLEGVVADHGLRQVLHPHLDTVVETAADVAFVLENSAVQLCLDTGHLAAGGYDPLELVKAHPDRVGLVHLKDARLGVADRFNRGELSLMEAVQEGLFCTLGEGDLAIEEIVIALEGSGYDQWYVLEQDAALTAGEPPVGSGPMLGVQSSLEFLRTVEDALASADTAASVVNTDQPNH